MIRDTIFRALNLLAKGKVRVMNDIFSLKDFSNAYEKVVIGTVRFKAVVSLQSRAADSCLEQRATQNHICIGQPLTEYRRFFYYELFKFSSPRITIGIRDFKICNFSDYLFQVIQFIDWVIWLNGVLTTV